MAELGLWGLGWQFYGPRKSQRFVRTIPALMRALFLQLELDLVWPKQ